MQNKSYWGKHEKSCFNCTKSIKSSGSYPTQYDPGEPPMAECDCPEVDADLLEQHDYDESKLPELCGHYDPVIVQETCNCGKQINVPEYEHVHWFTWYDMQPCCSAECVKAMEQKAHEQEANAYRMPQED